ncbi:MAG: DUF3806 domain-containing protein [Pseudomonadota bacterium]
MSRFLRFIPLVISLATSGWASAQEDPRIESLSQLDRSYMANQRQQIVDLAARHLGRGITGDTDRDLAVLQALLDRGIVRDTDEETLQAMGFVLGDLLADDLDMQWVVYEDSVGRSRALFYRPTDTYLFPVTMISRRRAVGNDTSVADIYQRAHDIVTSSIPPPPF